MKRGETTEAGLEINGKRFGTRMEMEQGFHMAMGPAVVVCQFPFRAGLIPILVV
jgi:hypothetical protein